MNVDMNVVRLLNSRMCHDLAGPAGAVHNGMELVEEMGADEGGEALKLVSDSVDYLSARLGFYRVAFGGGGLSGRKSPLTETRQLAEGFLKGGRVKLDWPDEAMTDAGPLITTPTLKLLLNMILVAIDALPRGGLLAVTLARMGGDQGQPAIGIAVKAAGDGARLNEGLLSALSPAVGENELNAHNVHGFFCQRLAQELSSEIEVSVVENEVHFAALVCVDNDRFTMSP